MKHRRHAIIAAGILFLAVPFALGSSAARAQEASAAAAITPAATTAAPASTAPATSTADELSQLRANQQLLQQRLDQLEQIAQVGPSHPLMPPGTVSLAGSFPRSFLIPGTDTSISISGQVDLDTTEWFHGGNPNISNTVVPSVYGNAYLGALSLKGSGGRSNWVFGASVYNSRLHFETRTPTAFGEADTVIEFDFGGCAAGAVSGSTDCSDQTKAIDGLLPRLRLAYATLGPWMFGQNWGIGTDLAAQPELFDTGGTVGSWGIGRIPEASYTWQLPTYVGPASLQVGLILPEQEIDTPAGQIANDTATEGPAAISGCGDCELWLAENPTKNYFPSPAFALTWNQPWGHVQAHGALIENNLQEPGGTFGGVSYGGLNQNFLGGGGGLSGNLTPGWFGWLKDNLGWNVTAGLGEGPYDASGSPTSFFPGLATNFGGPGSGCYGSEGPMVLGMTPNPTGCTGVGHNPALVLASEPMDWGFEVNYQHWWTSNLRSSGDFGWEQESLPVSLLGPSTSLTSGLNKLEQLAHLNLIWSPVPFVNTGFELFWGKRENLYDLSGTEFGLDYSFIMKF